MSASSQNAARIALLVELVSQFIARTEQPETVAIAYLQAEGNDLSDVIDSYYGDLTQQSAKD